MTKCCCAKATLVHVLNTQVIPLWIGVMDASTASKEMVSSVQQYTLLPGPMAHRNSRLKVLAVNRAGHLANLGCMLA